MLSDDLDKIHKELNFCINPFTFMIVQRKLNLAKLEEMIVSLEKCIRDLKELIEKVRKQKNDVI